MDVVAQEVRSGGPVGAAALPVVMAVLQRLGRAAFASLALPVLGPVLEAVGAGSGPSTSPAAAAAAAGAGSGAQQQYAMAAALVEHAEALGSLMDGYVHTAWVRPHADQDSRRVVRLHPCFILHDPAKRGEVGMRLSGMMTGDDEHVCHL